MRPSIQLATNCIIFFNVNTAKTKQNKKLVETPLFATVFKNMDHTVAN